MKTEAGSGPNAQGAPEAAISGGTNGSARRLRTVSRQHRAIMFRLEMGAVARLLQSRRFHENVIIGVIGLAALAQLFRENQARALARLVAWDKRRNLHDQRRAKARSA
jgi:hypothetical protein